MYAPKIIVSDSVVLIKLLGKMKCRDGIINLSQHCDMVVPEGVIAEVKNPSGWKILHGLIQEKIMSTVHVNQINVQLIMNKHNLGQGESEVIAYAKLYNNRNICIVTDDKRVQKRTSNQIFVKTTADLINIMKSVKAINDFEYKIKQNKLEKLDFNTLER